MIGKFKDLRRYSHWEPDNVLVTNRESDQVLVIRQEQALRAIIEVVSLPKPLPRRTVSQIVVKRKIELNVEVGRGLL